jgi:hypothetical protein
MTPLIDLTGQRFGRLTVIRRAKCVSRDRIVWWECVCDCDPTRIRSIRGTTLRNSVSTSCGCYTRERALEANTKYPTLKKAAVAYFYQRYKRDAKKRSLPFELSLSDFELIIHQACVYCGTTATTVFVDLKRDGHADGYYRMRANGVDRYDNAQGYSLANSVPCCGTCNIAKSARTAQDYVDHCKRVAEYYK